MPDEEARTEVEGGVKYVRREGRVWIVGAEAPALHIWNASGTHEYIGATFYTRPTRADVDRVMAECLKLGTSRCEDVDCEWCNSTEGETAE